MEAQSTSQQLDFDGLGADVKTIIFNLLPVSFLPVYVLADGRLQS
jgi:hypothetical protein